MAKATPPAPAEAQLALVSAVVAPLTVVTTAGTGEHEHLAVALCSMRPHDADHFGLPAMLTHLFQQGNFTRREFGSRNGRSRRQFRRGCRGHRSRAIATIKSHRGHRLRHGWGVISERHGTRTRIGGSVHKRETRFVELCVHGLQSSVKPFLVCRIGSIAHTNQASVEGEQTSATSPRHRLTSNL